MNDDQLRDSFRSGAFRRYVEGDWNDWRDRFTAHIKKVGAASEAEWMQPSFQEELWDAEAIARIGPGRSVNVQGAYVDRDLATKLLAARDATLPDGVEERGAAQQQLFNEILARVRPYSRKRPLARLVRLVNVLRPSDMCCLMDERRLWQVSGLLKLPQSKDGFIAQHAFVRARLREALGPTPTIKDDVEQSMFTWFLWAEHVPHAKQPGLRASASGGAATEVPVLDELLPASVQRRALPHLSDNIGLLVAIVRAVEHGLPRTDLISTIQREAPQLSVSSSAIVISQAQGGLALIKFENGAYTPTENGRELLLNPNPAQVLQPLLVGRVFGIGQMLLALKDAPDGIPPKKLGQDIANLLPTRNTAWAGYALAKWAISARLIALDGKMLRLTEDGEVYADALPPNFRTAWTLIDTSLDGDGQIDDADEAGETEGADASGVLLKASWEKLRRSFDDRELSSRLILPPGTLAELHAALHASDRKRFVLFAGLSGTGKTSIARAYAEAYCTALGLPDWRQHYAEVAVRPDWTDPAGLLGYINVLTNPPTFQTSEALSLLLRAHLDRSTPYFLCLDEMNLARVEHYFAPLLSAMEGTGGILSLHGEAEAIDNVPGQIPWPSNLFIFGTVNMDETTHPFSDKVLDRAFTFEFRDVDLESWHGKKRDLGVDPEVLAPVAERLKLVHAELCRVRRQFGYRVADEVLAFCEVGEASGISLHGLLDAAVHAKILPKLRGDDGGLLKEVIGRLLALLPSGQFPRSHRKLGEMAKTLAEAGQVRFWA
jgi:MoxR-like ATPase